MNSILNSFIVICVVVFTSCTKVIDIDLNSSDPQLIVEAKITDDATQKAEVRLNQSVNFDQSNTFPIVKNAFVTILDQTDNVTDTLKETGAGGVYQSLKLTGKTGHTYLLTVKTGSKTLTSMATIPRKVALTDIEMRVQSLFGNTSYATIPKFVDPKGIGDNYRFILSINGKLKNDIAVINDELSDGAPNGRPIFRGAQSDDTKEGFLKVGDTIQLEMQCIDKGVYDYFNTLASGGGGGPGGSTTPANPVTNVKGEGVSGYFTAHTTQIKSVVIK
ncbi:MAG: hypothetical protein U5L45_21500 [Saprospiraceae bacterium]|nr:hypothetical protein [Saprospiraceae bacterium]